jgi:hypothetical protein
LTSKAPVRDLGKARAKLASKVSAVDDFPMGKSSESEVPALAMSARNCATAGMDGAAVTVTNTVE